ncbi:MAG: hypothetical protein FWD13_05885 [Treponema sp.]|nr:hypothetical protein [Treponema sp.]
MKNTKNISILFFLVLIIFNPCTNVFEPPLNPNQTDGEKALVNIYIGEAAMASARTITPNQSAVAGYQLTFTGGTQAPVNIISSNHAQFFLGNGNWTITATAYKLGGQIGNSNDAVASGSIDVNITGGQVSGGLVPPIILSPIGSGNGTFRYEINIDTGITGSLTLWQIDGFSTVNSFGNNGVLSITSSSNGNITIPTGRYIAEARLTRSDNFIAFRREVVEIWSETISDFVFTPVVYLDPNAMLPNSEALLCETGTTINGNPIGVGIGSGASELDPRTYTFTLANRDNVSFELAFQTSSLYSTFGWAANIGISPDDDYRFNEPLPTDFSTNGTLWVKAVSEDDSKTMYYQFNVMVPFAGLSDFIVSGSNASGVSWNSPTLTITQSGTYHITGTGVATTHRIRVSGNGIIANIVIRDVNINVSAISDVTAFDIVNNATVNLTVKDENVLRSGSGRAGFSVPVGSTLTITAISNGSLTAIGGSSGAGIGGSGATVNASHVRGCGTIDIAGGIVIAIGGSFGAGIGGGQNGHGGTINIAGGIITATGGNAETNGGGAGIGGGGSVLGGGGSGTGGIINITGGVITATGGNGGGSRPITGGGGGGSGIGGGGGSGGSSSGTVGGRAGDGGIVSITGGIVNATGGNAVSGGGDGGTGIGGGGRGSSSSGVSGGSAGSAGSLFVASSSVVFTSSIQPWLNVHDSIIFIGNNGTLYGHFILNQNLTISSGRTLAIASGRSLTISNNVTLLNNGTIRFYGIINGIVSGNQPIPPELPISGDMSYSYTGEVLTITGNGTFTISMRSGLNSTTQGRIVVTSGVNANITLSGVNINSSTLNNTSAFDMTGATVNLTLVGENVLRSGSGMAGLTVPSGSNLLITENSTGSLSTTGGSNGAGIGGGVNVGSISIQGGTVTAIGSNSSAGIGGGINGGGGTVSITGGIVTSTGGTNGAGIGGGANGGGCAVSISGGIINANGGSDAFGIGRGSGFGSAGTLSIGNNSVFFANSIQAPLTEGNNVNNSIIFNGIYGILYGNVILQNNVTFSEGQILTIPTARSLTIPGNLILINNGTINNSGTITGNITGNQPIVP